jgi:hypothetical protein
MFSLLLDPPVHVLAAVPGEPPDSHGGRAVVQIEAPVPKCAQAHAEQVCDLLLAEQRLLAQPSPLDRRPVVGLVWRALRNLS